VSYMHRQGVCHRDLKPENIFLDSEWNVKVGDFGLSHRYQPGRKVNDPVGSLIYASPEVLRRESYVGPELDAWSMGILLYEMLCGTPPFVGETERDLCRAILAGEYSVPDFVSPGARSLISKLVKLKHYRISMEEVLNHPWIMEGLPAAVQRRSRKRRGSIMSASSEETSGSPKPRQAPKEARKKRKEGSARKSRKDQEAAVTLTAQPGVDSSVSAVAAAVAPVVDDVELAQRDLMTISAGDLAVVRAVVSAQTKPQILDDEEELATGGTDSPVVSGTLSPAVLASDLPPLMGPPKQQIICDDDEEAGALSGHLQKLDLSRESFPSYSKTASLRETLSVPVPPLRSLSSPVVQF
jgi:serine/threonine protein kinase